MSEALVANWNIEWASSHSARGRAIKETLRDRSPDVLCLTETYSNFLEADNVVEACADYGYSQSEGRRKVVLCSKRPWLDVDRAEHLPLPPGRFVAGTTETPIGPLKVIGVCIPWKDAHVRTGRRDRQPWEEHVTFLRALHTYLSEQTGTMIVLGDFNQRIPRRRQPAEVYAELMRCIDYKLEIPTRGLTDAGGAHAIDHLALSRNARVGSISVLPAVNENGLRLSDHFGFTATVVAAESAH